MSFFLLLVCCLSAMEPETSESEGEPATSPSQVADVLRRRAKTRSASPDGAQVTEQLDPSQLRQRRVEKLDTAKPGVDTSAESAAADVAAKPSLTARQRWHQATRQIVATHRLEKITKFLKELGDHRRHQRALGAHDALVAARANLRPREHLVRVGPALLTVASEIGLLAQECNEFLLAYIRDHCSQRLVHMYEPDAPADTDTSTRAVLRRTAQRIRRNVPDSIMLFGHNHVSPFLAMAVVQAVWYAIYALIFDNVMMEGFEWVLRLLPLAMFICERLARPDERR